VIERVFHGYFDQVAGLPAEPTPFNNRSDYRAFNVAGIPSGGLFTGAEVPKTPEQAAVYGGTAGVPYDPCYHAACDTYDNVSVQGLNEMSDAIAHVAIVFASSTKFLNGVDGKDNFDSPPMSEDSGGIGSGGGGLHDHHEDETG
jgi:Zn-dependent M28 family amino/carboxypeptidase